MSIQPIRTGNVFAVNQEEKSIMEEFQGSLFLWLNRLANCVFASLLWLVFSFPVFTVGASTVALYNTVHRCICHERELVWDCFWGTFKLQFKKSTKYWLIMLALEAFFCFDWWITYLAMKQGSPLGSMNLLCILPIIAVLVWCMYLFPYIARFPEEKCHILKNSAIMAVAHLHWSVVMLFLLAAGVLLILWQAVFLFISPGLVCIFYEKILEKIFYRIMTPEERKREEEEEALEQEDQI